MRGKRLAVGALLAAVAAVLVVPAAVFAVPDGSASVSYGNLNIGTQDRFPPPTDHDASFKGYDKIFPHSVVISAGGTVDFDVFGFHQVAVYEPGVTPDDIDVPPFPPESNIFINDGDGLLFAGPPTVSISSPPGAFATPGKYLMICNVTPHFAFANMYGWVIVK
jgi:plastocyanin